MTARKLRVKDRVDFGGNFFYFFIFSVLNFPSFGRQIVRRIARIRKREISSAQTGPPSFT